MNLTENTLKRKENKFKTQNLQVRERNLERADPHDSLRIKLAEIYLAGDGLEIGALHKPLNIPEDKTSIRYIDRLSAKDLKLQYPEVEEPMVHVNIVDNGETLSRVKKRSQNFVIANHFYEHCADPIQTLKNILRVLKPEGIVYMAIPDKRFTFDKQRPITKFQHIVDDHEKGPHISKESHFKEWAINKEGAKGSKAVNQKVKELIEMDYSIHYHVWDFETLIDYFLRTKRYMGDGFSLELTARNITENIVILKKTR
jgi:predicted SAM-dependent methyltransferase